MSTNEENAWRRGIRMTAITDLTLEVSDGVDPDKMGYIAPGMMITPALGEDFFYFRVKLNDTGQAILGFPKFGTIGIGFAQEEDWNTNLPYRASTEELYNHIKHNKADKGIKKANVLKAIKMVQEAAHRLKGTNPE